MKVLGCRYLLRGTQAELLDFLLGVRLELHGEPEEQEQQRHEPEDAEHERGPASVPAL